MKKERNYICLFLNVVGYLMIFIGIVYLFAIFSAFDPTHIFATCACLICSGVVTLALSEITKAASLYNKLHEPQE